MSEGKTAAKSQQENQKDGEAKQKEMMVKVTARISGQPCGPEWTALHPENEPPPASAAPERCFRKLVVSS